MVSRAAVRARQKRTMSKPVKRKQVGKPKVRKSKGGY